MRPDDADLIARFLQGDPGAVATLDEWIGRASRPYRRRLASQWEDVLQDLRLEITRLFQAGTFQGESSLKTYLWRVVNHSCLDQIRARKRWQWTDLETAEHQAAGAMSRPADQGERRETQDLLLRVLQETSKECQELWRMIFEGLSYREMSQRLGVSEGALRVRVLRCRKRAVEIRNRLLGDHS